MNVFSQIGTETKSDPNTITLSVPTAKSVVKDLIQGDSDKIELSLTQEKLQFTNEKIAGKDSLIITQKKIISNTEIIADERKNQISLLKEINEGLKKDLKNEKNKTLFWKITTGAAVVTGAILLIK